MFPGDLRFSVLRDVSADCYDVKIKIVIEVQPLKMYVYGEML